MHNLQRHLEIPIVFDEYERFETSCYKKRIFRDCENVRILQFYNCILCTEYNFIKFTICLH